MLSTLSFTTCVEFFKDPVAGERQSNSKAYPHNKSKVAIVKLREASLNASFVPSTILLCQLPSLLMHVKAKLSPSSVHQDLGKAILYLCSDMAFRTKSVSQASTSDLY